MKQRKYSILKIVVDTNIIFSGLLNTKGTIGELLFNAIIFLNFIVAVTCDTKLKNIGVN